MHEQAAVLCVFGDKQDSKGSHKARSAMNVLSPQEKERNSIIYPNHKYMFDASMDELNVYEIRQLVAEFP